MAGQASFYSDLRENQDISALIVDYRLSENETGLECIVEIFSFFGRKIPAMIITGNTEEKRVKELEKKGCVFRTMLNTHSDRR